MYQVIRLTCWDDEYSITPVGVFSTYEKAHEAMMESVHDCEDANGYCDPDYGEENDDGTITDWGCQSGPLDDNGMNWGFIYGDNDYSVWYIMETDTDEVNLYDKIEFGLPYITRVVNYFKQKDNED